jgi:hypothetical protein
MKKTLLPLRLYFPASFIVSYLLIAQAGFSQDCKTQAANKPTSSLEDFTLSAGLGLTGTWEHRIL